MIDVSVIIVNWNTKNYLLHCLESLFYTGEGFSKEVIVVDNGSQDGSVNELKKSFPSVHLIENKSNLGFAKAVNLGLQQASGRYLLLLNPDTLIKDGSIEELFSFMEEHREVAVTGPQLLNGDGSKQNSIANFPSLTTELLNKNLLRWLFPERYPGKEKDYSNPIEVDSVIGACMMVRREAMEQVGLLDEDYFLFLEETDWCYRMRKAGWKVYHVPQARVIHFQGKGAEKEKKRAKVEYYRSRYIFFKKNRGRSQELLLRMGLLIRLVLEEIFMFLACLFTLFSIKKLTERLSLYTNLLWWHLKGCPEGMGLKTTDNPPSPPFTKGGLEGIT
ncbi:MAG: glycosyltransferase family 2 protein [Thermodesulfobacteriota bacterium]